MIKRILAAVLSLFMLVCAAETVTDEARARLGELGYASYDISDAVANFQKANGMSVTGALDPATLNALNSSKAVSMSDYLKSCLNEEVIDRYYERGNTGGSVRRLQNQLVLLGYDLTANGEFDLKTFYAVSMFQAINGLPMTGKVDSATLTRIYSARAIPLGSFQNIWDLSAGSQGAEVKELQNELAEAGYFTGSRTGIFGSATLQAVLSFQKENGLDETGSWSLYQQLLINYGKFKTRYETDEYKASLSLEAGLRHECVKELETALRQKGYFNGVPDELFDAATYDAVRQFQEANGLIVTGIADPETRRLAVSEEAVKYQTFYSNALAASIMPGDESYAVYLCTLRLNELGYPLTPRWKYDDEVEANLTIFRQACGYEDAEGLDMEMRAYLNSDAAPVYNRAKLMSDNYLKRKNYAESVAAVTRAANQAVGKPYEAGKTGPDSYGTAGLIMGCYASIGIDMRPTVSLQYESAVNHGSYSANAADISEGRQLFFRSGESILTGICVGDGMMVTVVPQDGCVTRISIDAEMGKYEFIGSVFWS